MGLGLGCNKGKAELLSEGQAGWCNRLQQREGRAPLRRQGRMELGCNKGKAELLSEGQAGWG